MSFLHHKELLLSEPQFKIVISPRHNVIQNKFSGPILLSKFFMLSWEKLIPNITLLNCIENLAVEHQVGKEWQKGKTYNVDFTKHSFFYGITQAGCNVMWL